MTDHPQRQMIYPFPVEVDEEIASIINDLWQQGVVTRYSCQRDGASGTAYISFRDKTYPDGYARAGRVVCEVLRNHKREIVRVESGGEDGLIVRFVHRSELTDGPASEPSS